MAKLNIRNRNKGKLDKNGKPKAANWEYRFEAAKIDGKRKQVTKAGFRTKKEAEVAGTRAMAEYNSTGLTFEPSDMSYADYLDYWFETYVKKNCRYNTQVSYAYIIEGHLKPAIGQYKLSSLTPIMLQEYVNMKYNSNLRKNTLTSIVATITGSLKYAVSPAQLLRSSPAEYIKTPRVSRDRKEVSRTVISECEFKRMMKRFPKGVPHRYSLLIGYYTGLRISEVYALTWDDINFEEKTLSVNKLTYKRANNLLLSKGEKNIKEEKSAWYFGEPKTSASNRTIKFGDVLFRELKEYKAMQAKNKLQYGEYYKKIYRREEIDDNGNTIHRLMEVEASIPVNLPEANLIMRKENGEYSSSDSFKGAARIIHYDLGIKFNFHSLRHTHATKLIESGVSPKSVQARLGHETITTTLQTYVHNTEAMEQNAVEVFEQAVSAAMSE